MTPAIQVDFAVNLEETQAMFASLEPVRLSPGAWLRSDGLRFVVAPTGTDVAIHLPVVKERNVNYDRMREEAARARRDEGRRTAARWRIYYAAIGALLVAFAFALAGCGCSELNGPAAAIAKDFPLFLENVEPKQGLTLKEHAKVQVLGERLRKNVELLEEASR